MPRRAHILLLLTLAAGIAFGRFGVPYFLGNAFDSEGSESGSDTTPPGEVEFEAKLNAWLREEPEFSRQENIRARRNARGLMLLVFHRTGPLVPEDEELLDEFGAFCSTEDAKPVVVFGVMTESVINGTVRTTVDRGRLVMLDLGSEAGLSRHQRLRVRRAGPVPFDLGELEVEKLWPDHAVARAVRPCLPVCAGDQVHGVILRR
jgi:hypothetical protein